MGLGRNLKYFKMPRHGKCDQTFCCLLLSAQVNVKWQIQNRPFSKPGPDANKHLRDSEISHSDWLKEVV